MASIKDVAHKAGVSAQTVSNVLNNPEIVKSQTRQSVMKAIRELNYTPNVAARRLRTRRANTIAIGIYPEGSSPIFDDFLHAMAVETDAHNIRLLIYKADSIQEQIHQYEKLTTQGDVDAFVLLDTVSDDKRIAWMLEHHQRFVLFGRPWGAYSSTAPADFEGSNAEVVSGKDQAISWVDVDNFTGIYELTQQLILHGKKRIGFIGCPSATSTHGGTDIERYNGWKQAMLQAHMVSHEELLNELSIFIPNNLSAAQDATVTLTDRWPDLDAIVCVSDTVAAGATLTMGQFNGFDSSEDSIDNETAGLTITGFDNSQISRSLGFTSIKQPVAQVSHEIVRMLVHSPVSDKEVSTQNTHKLLKPQIVWR